MQVKSLKETNSKRDERPGRGTVNTLGEALVGMNGTARQGNGPVPGRHNVDG